MTAPAYSDHSSIVSGADPLSVNYPASISADDILIIAMITGYGNEGMDVPSGWARIGAGVYKGTGYTGTFFWKRAVGSESGSVTVTGDFPFGAVAVMIAISDCITTETPYEDFDVTKASGDRTRTTLDVDSSGYERTAFLIPMYTDGDGEAATGYSNYTKEFSEVSGDNVIEFAAQAVPAPGSTSSDDLVLDDSNNSVESIILTLCCFKSGAVSNIPIASFM